MRLSPPQPSFLEERNAILQADVAAVRRRPRRRDLDRVRAARHGLLRRHPGSTDPRPVERFDPPPTGGAPAPRRPGVRRRRRSRRAPSPVCACSRGRPRPWPARAAAGASRSPWAARTAAGDGDHDRHARPRAPRRADRHAAGPRDPAARRRRGGGPSGWRWARRRSGACGRRESRRCRSPSPSPSATAAGQTRSVGPPGHASASRRWTAHRRARSLGGMDELGAALEAAGGSAAGPETRGPAAHPARRRAAPRRGRARPARARATTRRSPSPSRPRRPDCAPSPRSPPAAARRPRRRRRARVAARRRARRRARRGRGHGAALADRRDRLEPRRSSVPGDPDDAELVPLAFEGQVAGSTACAPARSRSPAFVLADVARPARRRSAARTRCASPRRSPRSAGARPTTPRSPSTRTRCSPCSTPRADGGVARPHDDPDPARRVARRILQRLNGMGKWGGYHTDFAHLARGFAGNDRSARRGGRRGAARGRPARREAERRPAPRVPQPAPRAATSTR